MEELEWKPHVRGNDSVKHARAHIRCTSLMQLAELPEGLRPHLPRCKWRQAG